MSEELDDDISISMRFDLDLIRKYPRSNRKLSISVEKYGLDDRDTGSTDANQSQFISPHGVEFRTSESFQEGALLKIHVTVPNYWSRKQKLVDYNRIDQPDTFRILAKVVECSEVGKRGKKRLVTCQTLVIDEVDEQVLKNFLQDG